MDEIFSKIMSVNNHTVSELRRHYCSEYIVNPDQLPDGCFVVVFAKGFANSWADGTIGTKSGKKVVYSYRGYYNLDDVEVYLRI